MENALKLGDLKLYWLDGGRLGFDGGAMFGVVPKKVWQKRLPADDENFIDFIASPILVRTPETVVIIETGFGNKLTEKQKKIFRVTKEWNILKSLSETGLSREDVEHVILTHLDFDHAGGIAVLEDEEIALTFPNAKHHVQAKEWEDANNPNRRAAHSYWPINFEMLRDSEALVLAEGDKEIVPGISVVHSGGHHRGHQIVTLESNGEKAIHMGDVLPTHIHFNPLWVMGYDDHPIDVISLREKWEHKGIEEGAWFTFYHDPLLNSCKFDPDGNVIQKWPE